MVVQLWLIQLRRIEWIKLKRIYKELQKKQMSQLKETMKERSTNDSKTTKDDEQEDSVKDLTSKMSSVDAPTSDENAVTVEITMSTLPADEVEVCS